MKNLSVFIFLTFVVFSFSCSDERDEPPLVEKNARIEVDFGGSLDQYMINFGIHSLYKGENGFVTATIRQPNDMEWTQVISQANTFNLSAHLSFPKLVVESEEAVHTFGFIFNVVHTGDIPDENFEDLSATIRVFGDNTEVQTFQYTARPVGEVSDPLSETVKF